VAQEGLELSWRAGQNSALDQGRIDQGRDVGSVRVSRGGTDVPHVVTFAFAFFAFNPQGVLYTESGPLRQSDGKRNLAQ
jgi:hypothetical protein